MQTLDTVVTLGTAALIAALSVTTLSQTDLGDPSTGLANGTYQRGFEHRFERTNPSYEGAVSIWASARWVLFREAAEGAVAGSDGWLFTAEEFIEPVETRDLAAELSRVTDALAVRDVKLVPVIVPDKARMQRQRLPRGRSDGFELRYDIALYEIAAVGLPAIDLRPALDFDASFMRTDTHWSPEGARRAALILAQYVACFDIASTQVSTASIGALPFEGDLMSFVATGAFRDWIGPAAETLEMFETTVAGSGDLFADVSVPVALVGTSYSAKPEFHFEGFLKHALQADVLNASLVGQGPFAPMDAFLDQIEALSSPLSLVIWEIPERFLTSRSHLK